jgi:addiction module HigA family antidote
MIRSFRSRVEQGIWRGDIVPALPIQIQQRARRKLRMLNQAQTLADVSVPPGNRLERLAGSVWESTASGSMSKGVSVSAGQMGIVSMSKSLTTTDGRREVGTSGRNGKLRNIHPGEVLREEFLEPMKLTAYRLAKNTGIPQMRISLILREQRGITADTALRFATFFGTSPKFWLGLQEDFDLEEAGERISAELARITPVTARRRAS